MNLLTHAQRHQLRASGRAQRQAIDAGTDVLEFKPVLKIFTPDAGCTWLLTELTPDNPELAFGLCDPGLGEPKFGYVSLGVLQTVRGKLGLPIERDRSFDADKTIAAYANDARERRRIVV